VAKSAEAFRTISEASKEVGVPQHVLRHWEDVFGNIRPMRRAGGRRYYRPLDIDLLRGVRVLLYDERYTTKGVQKIFKENGAKYIAELGRRVHAGDDVDLRRNLDELRNAAPLDGAVADGQATGPVADVAADSLTETVLSNLAGLKDGLEDLADRLDSLADDLSSDGLNTKVPPRSGGAK